MFSPVNWIKTKTFETKGDVQFSPFANIGTRAVKRGIELESDKPNKDYAGIGLDALQTAMETSGVPGTAHQKLASKIKPANYGVSFAVARSV